ncbi:MAG TPA: hypothetical protein VIV60_18980, partial [Polyangiaceae bacterium]
WSDVAVPPYCPLNDEDRVQVAASEDKVIDRLYVLNAERAAEETRLGRGAKSVSKRRGTDDEVDVSTRPGASSVGKAAKKQVEVADDKGRERDGHANKGLAKKPRGKKGGSEGQGNLFRRALCKYLCDHARPTRVTRSDRVSVYALRIAATMRLSCWRSDESDLRND